MSKLLVVGLGPLLEEGARQFGGQCLRTWYFAKPLIDDGHTVRLVTLPIYDPNDPNMHKAALMRRSCEGFQYQAFTNCDFDFIDRTLGELARSFDPDAIVAVNIIPAWVAARLRIGAPLWADLNGYEMTEKQGQAARIGSDDALFEAWRRESLVARRADKLSTVSRAQLHALLGEMAGLGRLNRHTFHYHFVHHVPNAFHPAFAEVGAGRAGRDREPLLRGKIVPEDAFILLWSGGYNYWTNPQFLFDYLELVLAADPTVHYVSTGGAIAGYNDTTYAEFQSLVESSMYRDRYHLLGWVPAGDLPAIYHESDLGLNIDEPNYETFFGARNRINNLMAAGVAVLTTYGSEISATIEEAGCGVVCPPTNVAHLAEATLGMIGNPGRCRHFGQRGHSYAISHFAPETLTAPVREWAHAPRLAPDNAEKLRHGPDTPDFRHVPSNYLDAVAAVAEENDLLALLQDRADLRAIRGKRGYRMLKAIKDMARRIARFF